MATENDNVCFCSYNSTGFGSSAQNYISSLLVFSDILCIQEHFLLDSKDKKHSNTNQLKNKLGAEHDMYIVPAVKNNSEISRGRGKGGLATIWRRSLTKYVSKIACDNFRLQATSFSFPSGSVLVINTYFPCDPKTEGFDDTELLTLLADIQTLVTQTQCAHILLAGDLNCHFSRYNRFTTTVQEFMEEINLTLLWLNPDANPKHKIDTVDFTYCSVNNGVVSYSTIDHFAMSQQLFNAVAEAGVLHSGDNMSNHAAIYSKVMVGSLDLRLEIAPPQERTCWYKASEEAKLNFKLNLAEKLNQIQEPLCFNCSNVHCQCQDHIDSLEDYTLDILEAMETAGTETLPVSKLGGLNVKNQKIHGWNEHVRPYANECRFWHEVWVSAGKPIGGDIFLNMKHSKRQFKFAVRRLKRCADRLQADRFVSSLLESNVNFFQELKKFRGKNSTFSSRIDD